MRMIWEQDCGKIVMLTSLMEDMKKKCEQYWPNSGSLELGLITVTLLDEETYADFVIRVLQLRHANEKGRTKTVKQFHFTSWPDHGVPSFATPLLNFREKILTARSPLKGPVVVHCSAGIGRTGTFIGLDYLINQAKKEGHVDVPACVTLMRKQRVNMIQTQEQYQFLHEALVEALKLSECSIPSAEFQATYKSWETPDPTTGKTPLKEQFKALQEMTVPLRKTDFKAALHPENKSKNRSAKILAADSSRPFLSTPVPGGSDYINAVFLPAYKMKRAFILTQTPLPNTVLDFWRLVFEQNVSSIVMLNVLSKDKPNKSAVKYWPESEAEFGPFLVETLEIEAGDMCDVRTLQITYKKEEDKKFTIKQFLCKFWSDGTLSSSVSTGILSVLEEVERWQQQSQNRPILVHCLDGVTKSGLFCVASSVRERLKVDQEVNILQTVKQMRIHRPEIITDLEQFRFLHKLVLAYLESFQTYSNFK
ncbi:receptor-type tyrosine-protein phosphatase U-like [Liolophura sinensis]|uniref:receptor-type tyrosine-protein phosphatase U-like n=1 Tax=Liolophura sinensis TaxID=3198878 RepID=UPI0031591138